MEESILKLNRYLPENLRTNDISKLIDILDVILSTRLVISSLDILTLDNIELSNGDNSYTLPNEINSIILEQLHPYYIQGYCNTSKSFDNTCKSNIYLLLRKWCYPNLSVRQIMDIFPNATFNNLVELALVYSPIPESVNVWDRVTLFYYACKLQYPEPHSFIKSWLSYSSLLYTILWICYKFGRHDIVSTISKWVSNDYWNNACDGMIVLIDTKASKFSTKSIFTSIDEEILQSITSMLTEKLISYMNTLIDYEEIVELIIMIRAYYPESYASRYYNQLIAGINNFQYNLQDENAYSRQLFLLSIMYSAMKIGKDRVQQLINKHGLRDTITVDYSIYALERVKNRYVTEQLWKEKPELVEQNIPIHDRAIYYLTSGDFLNYIKYRHEHKLEISWAGGRFDGYLGLNDFGQRSFNNDLQKAIFINGDFMGVTPGTNINKISTRDYERIWLIE